MPKIFINYRREDSEAMTGRIHDHLEPHFGSDNVFIDVNTIPAGADFRKHLEEAISKCDVVLVVIGQQWLRVKFREGPLLGQRRLDDPRDFVRIEIQSALARRIPVIPVLVGNAKMPPEQMLPKEIKDLCYRHAIELRSGKDFRVHMQRLILSLEKMAPGKQSANRKLLAKKLESVDDSDLAEEHDDEEVERSGKKQLKGESRRISDVIDFTKLYGAMTAWVLAIVGLVGCFVTSSYWIQLFPAIAFLDPINKIIGTALAVGLIAFGVMYVIKK